MLIINFNLYYKNINLIKAQNSIQLYSVVGRPSSFHSSFPSSKNRSMIVLKNNNYILCHVQHSFNSVPQFKLLHILTNKHMMRRRWKRIIRVDRKPQPLFRVSEPAVSGRSRRQLQNGKSVSKSRRIVGWLVGCNCEKDNVM